MSDRLATAFEVCLQALSSGASLEACLGLYPHLAEELRPALEAAVLAGGQPAGPTPAAQAHSRARLLAQAARARSRNRGQALRRPLPRLAFTLAGVTLVLVVAWGSLTTAAAQSLPGETLYRVKRADESLRLELARDSEAERSLRLAFNQRREAEARELLRLGRKGPVTFQGVVESQSATRWMISSLPVALSADTQIAGPIEPGDSVIVVGTTRPEGDILASEILLHTYQMGGRLEQQAQDRWVVSGQPLRLTATSQVQPGIRTGDPVFVLVEVQPGGEHVALVILSLATRPASPDAQVPGPLPATPESAAGPYSAGQLVEFTGRVEAHQGSIWTVGGRILLQTAHSEIRGGVDTGDHVRVRAAVSQAGGLILLRMDPLDSEADGPEKDSGSTLSDNDDSGSSDNAEDDGDNHGGDDDDDGDDDSDGDD